MTNKLKIPDYLMKIISKYKNMFSKAENIFLFFAISFGVLFIFLTPPMQAPDERVHFFQAYAVSNFDFVPDRFESHGVVRYGAKLPSSVFDAAEVFIAKVAGYNMVKFDTSLYRQYINQPLNPESTEYRESGTLYTPIPYIPQAIGITIGKVLEAPPLVIIWLGRLANLIAWLIIIYFSIKIIPYARWTFAILALNPILIFLSASLSADVTSLALTVLLFSLVVYTIDKTNHVSNKLLILIFTIATILALTKPTNAIFTLLLLLIPYYRFKNKIKYILYCSVGVILPMIFVGIWGFITNAAMKSAISIQRPGMYIDGAVQLTNIINSPLTFIKLLILNYIIVPIDYVADQVLTSSIGVLGWLDTFLPLWVIILYIITVFLCLLYQFGRGLYFSNPQKIIIIAIASLVIFTNILAMYLYFTPVGNHIIAGVQGRYFIGAVFILSAIFTGRKKILYISRKKIILALSISMFIILTMTFIKILTRYYQVM